MTNSRHIVVTLLERAGITPGGDAPHDIQIHDDRFFDRILAEGSIGLGESYMDGWWDVERLDEFFTRALRARLDRAPELLSVTWHVVRARLLNLQTVKRSRRVAERHYDLGNPFFADMLDPSMLYTCAFWESATDLEQAQADKCELICRKLRLEPGESVLDLGCGWGGFARYAARTYGCRVTGYNISREQVRYANEHAGDLPLEFILGDYREATGSYDKVVSIGMLEHVGKKNHRTAMRVVERCLKDDGLFLLHTIGRNSDSDVVDAWVDKYIFPGGLVPSLVQISRSIEKLFILEHFHGFGPDYDRTLMAWYANFERNWHKHEARYGPRFHRMWSYYLLSCAGTFRARRTQLWQWVLSKRGLAGGYDHPRRETDGFTHHPELRRAEISAPTPATPGDARMD